MCSLIDPYAGVCSSKLSQHIGRKRTGVCRVMVSFQIWMSVSFIMFVIRIFLGVTEWCRTSSGKSGTSVRYQSFGCSASGHLENICTNRRSQMFLWIRWDEFLPQTLWHLLSLSLPPHCQHHFASESFLGTVGNVCLGKSQNQIQSWECCVFKAEIKYFKQLFYNLSNSLW